MSATIAIRFPLGRYHATPWDRSVNEGAVEWPPSPWRLLRTLVATWYTRWPDLPASTLDSLLETLGEPPSYLAPETTPGHSRHYLPDLNHMNGETGATDLALDPYLWIKRDAELLVRWDDDLTVEQRTVLAKLVELVPYLGRAESVCEARLLDTDPVPDGRWWTPSPGRAGTVWLLAPTRPVRRAVLELSTVEVRRDRRTMPPGTTWVTYAQLAADQASGTPAPRREVTMVDAIRFAVMYRAPVKNTNGVLLADEVHRIVTRALNGGRVELLGHAGATTNHQHAHWIPLAPNREPATAVESLVIWVGAGLNQEEVAKILAADLRGISGRRASPNRNGYEVKGLPEVDLLLQAVGEFRSIVPELSCRARRWRSLTPYLPVRHRKRESLDEYVTRDLQTELRYRGLEAGVVVNRETPGDGLSDRWALGFRRYRLKGEHLGKARRGLGLRLEFDDEVDGPLLLGQLSHFGYGIFLPER